MSETKQTPKNRFYWLEGVSRSAVEKSLTDRRPSLLRRQGPRRVLVATSVALLLALLSTAFVQQPKLASYLEVALMVACFIGYLKLRNSVRIVSDAPDELLDERQIVARNAAYVVAYRWLAIIAVLFLILIMALADGGVVPDAMRAVVRDRAWSGLHMSFLLAIVSLPAMVLAWRTPSEPPEEPRGEPV
jgi:hypothetical protein